MPHVYIACVIQLVIYMCRKYRCNTSVAHTCVIRKLYTCNTLKISHIYCRCDTVSHVHVDNCHMICFCDVVCNLFYFQIFNEHKPCEIDPTRMREGDNLKTNMVSTCAPNFCHICNVCSKFPGKGALSYVDIHGDGKYVICMGE